MILQFAGQTRAYTSEEGEEIISISPDDEGNIAFLVCRNGVPFQEWRLVYDREARTWRDVHTAVTWGQEAATGATVQ